MIWVYIKSALLFLLRLVYAPPVGWNRTVDPDAKCPACGHCCGSINFARVASSDKDVTGIPLVAHTCLICHFKWGETPIGNPAHPLV